MTEDSPFDLHAGGRGPSEALSLPLCGRAVELGMLRAALGRAEGGESATVVLVGSEGMGKTRLARAVVEQAGPRGFRVGSGTAYAMECGVPYALFCDLLDPLTRGESTEALVALTRGAPEFRFVCPSLAIDGSAGFGPTPDSIPDLRNRLLWNFPEFLDRLRRSDPLLLVLEDIEWGDPSSLELLHFLTRRPLDLPVVIVCTLDPGGSPSGPRILEAVADICSRPGAELRVLPPLEPDDVVEMIARGFGVDGEVVRGFAGELCRWTGGNPLFVRSTLESLVASGRIHRAGGHWVGWDARELEPPRSVESQVLDRVEELSPESAGVATLAAVIGPRIRFEVLERASPLDERALLRSVDELVDIGILGEDTTGEDPVLTFVHPVHRVVLYRAAGSVRARRLHGEVFRALMDLYGSRATEGADELAVHVERAGSAVEPVLAVQILGEAGHRALRAHADREATRYLDRARHGLSELPEGVLGRDDRVRILTDLGRAMQRRGRYEEATRHFREAREMEGGGAAAAALDRRLGLAAFWAGRGDEALEHWERGLGALDGSDAPGLEARIHLARSACLQERGRIDEAAAAALEALRLGASTEEVLLKLTGHVTLTLLYTWAGPTSEARRYGEAAVELAERDGGKVSRLSAHWVMAVLEGMTGHPERLRRHLDQARPLAADLASPHFHLRLAEVEIEYAARIGEWQRGTDLAAESIRMARELNQRLALPRLLVLSALLHLARGDVDEAAGELDEAWELAGAGPGDEAMTVHTAILARAGRAALHQARGEFERAIEVAEEGMALVDRSGYRAWGVHRLLPTIAESSLHVRDLDRARRTADRLRVEADRFDHPVARNWAGICEALATWLEGDPVGGAEGMAAGAEALEAMGLLPDAARLRRQLAGRLTELGDREGAVRELRRVHEILSALGAEPELEKAREQFREIGVRPPVRTQGERGAELLTAREVEVARLIADRKSNKAIARVLGISPRTVGTHLTNIFRKLQVGTRWELGDRVREGLLETTTVPGPD